MTNDEIQNIFFLECEEALGQAEEGLLACRSGTADADTVNGIFRAVHSIKGGAGAFSFSLLQAFIHKFETVLSYVRDEELGLSEALNTLMLRAFDILADHVAAVRGEGDTPDDAAISAELEDVAAKAAAGVPVFDEPAESACDEPAEPAQDDGTATDDLGLDFDLDGLMGDLSVDEEQAAAMEAAAAEVERSMDERDAARVTKAAAKLAAENASGDEHHGWRVYVRFLDGALGNGSEPLLMLRELEEMGALCLAADASAIPTLDALDVEKAYLSWTFFVPAHIEKSAIEEVFDFINNECELKIEVLHAPVARDTIEVRLPHIAAATPKKPKANTAPATTATSITPASQTAPAAHPAKVALVETPAPVAPAAPAAARTAASVGQTVRVDLAKLDKLIDTVGELVIAQAMMAQCGRRAGTLTSTATRRIAAGGERGEKERR